MFMKYLNKNLVLYKNGLVIPYNYKNYYIIVKNLMFTTLHITELPTIMNV